MAGGLKSSKRSSVKHGGWGIFALERHCPPCCPGDGRTSSILVVDKLQADRLESGVAILEPCQWRMAQIIPEEGPSLAISLQPKVLSAVAPAEQACHSNRRLHVEVPHAKFPHKVFTHIKA